MLVLATQRGNIECGGLRYLIIGYGPFHQLVVPAAAGHVSVAFELASSPADHLPAIFGQWPVTNGPLNPGRNPRNDRQSGGAGSEPLSECQAAGLGGRTKEGKCQDFCPCKSDV